MMNMRLHADKRQNTRRVVLFDEYSAGGVVGGDAGGIGVESREGGAK